MSITDELREYAEAYEGSATHASLDLIADRIDAEHENAMAAAAFIAGVPMTDEHMAEHSLVRLPLDADGVPIRVGDVMEWPTTHETFEVVGIGDGTLFYIEDGSEQADWTGASTKRHHHAPTVEDVLRNVVTLCHNTWKEESPFHFYDVDDVMKSGNIADFAAKLRLAGSDAE